MSHFFKKSSQKNSFFFFVKCWQLSNLKMFIILMVESSGNVETQLELRQLQQKYLSENLRYY